MSRLRHILGRYLVLPMVTFISVTIVLVLILSAVRQPSGQFPVGQDLRIRGSADIRRVYLGYERAVGLTVLDERGELIRERVRESDIASFHRDERRWPAKRPWCGFSYTYFQRSPDIRELMITFGPPDPKQARFRAIVRNPSLFPNTRIETVSVGAPTWFVLLLLVAVPAWYFAFPYRCFRVRGFRQEHGLCLKCGYDLRGTPQRCPECGLSPELEAVP